MSKKRTGQNSRVLSERHHIFLLASSFCAFYQRKKSEVQILYRPQAFARNASLSQVPLDWLRGIQGMNTKEKVLGGVPDFIRRCRKPIIFFSQIQVEMLAAFFLRYLRKPKNGRL
jgi:hypothetical protein